MAKNSIDLTLKLTGGEETFKTIDQLRLRLQELQDEISDLEFDITEGLNIEGSQERLGELYRDLGKVEQGIESVGKTASQTQKQTEQNIASFIKLGGALTTGFAAAKSAFALFGSEGKDLQEAATKAQTLLTLGLAANAVAQEAATFAKIKDTAVTIANTIAQQGLVAALRLLWATMLANPITAILALLGALVSLLVIFADSTDKAAEAEEAFQKALAQTNTTRERTIELLQAQGASETTLYQTKLKFALQAQNDAQRAYDDAVRRGDKDEYIEKRRQELEEATHKNRVLNAQYQTYLREEADKKEDERQKKSKEYYQKEVERVNKIIELLNKEYEATAKLVSLINPLAEYQTEVNKSLDENVKTADGFSKKLDELVSVTKKYSDLVNNLNTQQDVFGNQLKDLRDGAEEYFDALKNGEIDVKKALLGIQGVFSTFQINNFKNLTDEQRKIVAGYRYAYQEIVKTFKLIQDAQVTPPFDLKQWEEAIIDLSLLEGKIALDPFERTPEAIERAKLSARQTVQELEESFVESFKSSKLKDRLAEYAREANKTVSQLTPEQVAAVTASLEEQGRTIFNNLKDSTQQVVIFEEGVLRASNTTNELNSKLEKLKGTAKEGFVLTNIEEFLDTFLIPTDKIQSNRDKLLEIEKQINSKRYDEQKVYQQDVLDLEEYFLSNGVDISQFSYETKLVLLKEYLTKEVEATEEAEEKKQKKQQETLDKINESIQNFRTAITSISQTLSDLYSAQLDNLDRESEATKEKIIGDSEESVKKRLEAEEYYEKKRKEIEKKANITALRFSQIQAVANIAEAITKVTAQTGVGAVIAAGIVAAAGAAQIGIIQSQINSLNSYQRGGLIKGQGGLLVGPSHEYGGIRYGAMGLELEGGEAVINRQSRIRYNDLLSQININGGGRPLVQNNFDDSRIVEAIAKQRQEPIRAYVIESDISNKQAITRRLERLSQF
jgi:hypothetical protein